MLNVSTIDTQKIKRYRDCRSVPLFCAFVGLLPIKPLGNIIADYTAYDRNYNVEYVFHE